MVLGEAFLHCVCDDSNHEMLGMEEIRRKGGAGEKFLGPHPLGHWKMPHFNTEYGLF